MKILRKLSAALLVSVLLSVNLFPMVTFSNTVYKDITSISIKTNFNLDYESIQEEGIPDIEVADTTEDGTTDWNVSTSSTKYYIESAEWYESDVDEFGIGGQPRIVAYLVTKDYPNSNTSDRDIYYRFLSSYSSSTCYVGSGTYVSAQRQSTDLLKVVFKLRPLKGTYNQPDDAFWADDKGTAQWYAPSTNDSGYYDLVLTRDSTTVARINAYHGNAYNFYQYMTKPGDYMYKVRTVGGNDIQATYGKNSEYIESTSLVITEDNVYDPTKGVYNYDTGISDVPGTYVTNPAKIGWIQQNNTWYFVRPDGQMIKNGWVEWNGKWYFLKADGAMATGWLENNGQDYYLQSDGAMLVGWLSSANTYFYFNDQQGQRYGSLCRDEFIIYNGKYFYFDSNGIMVTGWRQIRDANGNVGFYYFYQNGEVNGLYGYMATNTTINGFYVGADGRWTQ